MKIINYILDLVRNEQTYKFGVVAIFAASSVMTLTWILTSYFRLFHAYSVAIAVELSIVWAFFVLDRWAFKEIEKKYSTLTRFVRYNLITLFGLGINETILLSLTLGVQMNYLLAEFFAILCTGGYNFYMNKKIAWTSYH